MNLSRALKILSLFPIVAIAAFFSLMFIFNVGKGTALASTPSLLILNVIFLTGTGIVLAVISAKGYLNNGFMNLLFLGLSMLGLGLAATLAGLAAYVSINSYATIFDVSLLFTGAIQLMSGILTFNGAQPNSSTIRKQYVIIAYSAVVFTFIVFSIFAFLGFAPIFFTTAPTLTSQWVLILTMVFFSCSAGLYGLHYLKTKSRSLYWYVLALALFSISIVGIAALKTPNASANWAARSAQYFASLYLVASLLSSKNTSDSRVIKSEGLWQDWTDEFCNEQERIGSLLNNIADGFAYSKIICDSKDKPIDYVFLDMNDKFTEITGLNKKEALGKTAKSVFLGEKGSAENIETYGRVALEEKPAHLESYVKSSDKWLSIIAYSPKKGYFVELIKDITKGKKTEEALKKTQADLEVKSVQLTEAQAKLVKAERLAAIGELAGMIGHDLRNPLAGIKNAAYFLEKKGNSISETQSKEMFDAINRCIAYSNKIINDLQDYSREIRLERKENSPRKLLMDVMSLIQIPEKIKIQNNLANEPFLYVDTEKIERVFINLIKNAIDAMPNGGEVTIDGREINGSIQISVADTGTGISDEVLPKLFTPLSTTKAQGMGFGLAISKRMVEAHGGQITIETIKDKGSTFTVSLPTEPKPNAREEKIWITNPEQMLSTTTKK